MKKLLLTLAFGFAVLPVASLAQMSPDEGPPPEVRAQLEQARSNAKTKAMNALSADHHAKVQAIVSQVESGGLSRRDAGTQIDGFLTPQESQAVLAAGKKMRDAMRAAFEANRPSDGSIPNGGPPSGGGRPGSGRRTPDAGMTLIMLNGPPRDERPMPSSTP